MGKIKTEGRVTLEFEPDLYEISITVRAEGKTSGAAVTAGKKQTEQLLQSLQEKLGIKPEQISAEDEDVSAKYNQDCYAFSRTLRMSIPTDNYVREAVTDLLAEMNDVTYYVQAKMIDEKKHKQKAIDMAVQCAKDKAEQIAASMHSKVTDFEEICTDGIRPSGEFHRNKALSVTVGDDDNLAANLKIPKIKIEGVVVITWLTEPLT